MKDKIIYYPGDFVYGQHMFEPDSDTMLDGAIYAYKIYYDDMNGKPRTIYVTHIPFIRRRLMRLTNIHGFSFMLNSADIHRIDKVIAGYYDLHNENGDLLDRKYWEIGRYTDSIGLYRNIRLMPFKSDMKFYDNTI